MDYLNPEAAQILARAPHSASGGLDDQVYNRLLRESAHVRLGHMKTIRRLAPQEPLGEVPQD